MKRTVCMMLALAALATPVMSQGIKLGVGVNGGLDIPVLQDDQKQGTIFGFRGRVNLIPLITVEPNLMFTSYGDPDLDDPDYEGITADLDGSKITSYGVDGTIGTGFGMPGFQPFGIAGIGMYKVKNDQTGEDDSNFGWSAGLGFGLGITPQIGADIRGKAVVIPIEGASKKSIVATVGLYYYFGQ
jgi:opacity protein-like surface antigen